jgi:hypothetical protein
MEELFINENAVTRIGGRLQSDYFSLKRDIEYINAYFFGLFSMLKMDTDLDLIIEILNSEFRKLKIRLTERIIGKIDDGKIPKERFLTKNVNIDIDSLPEEERKKALKRERGNISRAINKTSNRIVEQYLKDNNLLSLKPRHNKRALEMCRNALFVTPLGIGIDGAKFVEIYKSYMAADESKTKKIHQAAADAINRFFNGLRVTDDEMSRYFIFDGIIKPNPQSINLKDYARLGGRKYRRVRDNAKKNGKQK